MRAAQSRVGIIDSAGEVRRAVESCARALPVPVRFLKIGATAAAGTVGVGLLTRMLRPRRRMNGVATPSGMTRFLISELVVGLLLPLCRSYLFNNRGDAAPPQPSPGGLLSRLFRGR